MRSVHRFLSLLLSLITLSVASAEANLLDVQHVTGNVYAIVGPTANRDPGNLGNNATFGLVVTSDGAILIDSGGTYQGAQMLHDTIKSITDQPVTIVINSGGQDHRWMGNTYFKEQGAKLIASNNAVADHKARTTDQLFMLSQLVGDERMAGTETVTYADETFDDSMVLELGGEIIEIHHKGAAHTPGDSYIWLPEQKVLFSGDIVYVQRMLGVGPMSNSRSWIEVLEAIQVLNPAFIIPGHGPVTTLEDATRDSYDYLVYLRDAVRAFLDEGKTMDMISEIEQSRFAYLENFDTLSGRNAQQVFIEMEWE